MKRWLLVILLAGCSPSAEIASRSNAIADRARVDIRSWERVGKECPELTGEATAGIKRAEATLADTNQVHRSLTGVEDQTPWWAGMIGWIAVAVVAVCIVVVLMQTGLGTAIRVAIGWIPRATKRDASLAAAMLNGDQAETPREYIAARRAADPYFDRAFQNAKQSQPKPPAA